MINVIHAIRGRARYAVKELYRSKPLKRHLEQQLSDHQAIQTVFANPKTGNVLVTFDKDWDVRAIADLIEKSCFIFHQKSIKQPESKPQKKRQSRKRDKDTTPREDQPTQDWHKLDKDAVLEEFQTSKQEGLSDDAAAANQTKYGPNVLLEGEARSDISIFLEQFQSLPVVLLSGAAVLSVVTGGVIDAVVIMGVVGINAIVGYLTESQSEYIIRSLQEGGSQQAEVLRSGEIRAIATEDVVPGDLLLLQTGDVVAADARLISTDNLSINESSLTGESVPVIKHIHPLEEDDIPLPERINMVYKGTVVTGGSGRAVVVATGRFTEIGKIQQMVGEAESEATPLEQQLDDVGSQLVMLSGGICGVVFAIGLMRGYGLLSMLKLSISLAVAAVPEGLPTVATTTLALGMQNMRDRHILIRKLQAVEALGAVQTICLDKTGTLTENEMVVKEVRIGNACLQVNQGQFTTEAGERFDPANADELKKLIQVCALCSETEINRAEDGADELQGSSTENALVKMAIAAGTDVKALRKDYPLLETYLRCEDRNIMTTVHAHGNERFIAVKGSPEEVLACCQTWMSNGEIQPLDDEKRCTVSLDNDRMAGRALRVLGVAFKRMSPDQEVNPDAVGRSQAECNLTWLGLTGMADPIREGVPDLIEGFHRAGIDTVMITGDQSATAYAIARELQLNRHPQIEILDSTDLSGLGNETMQALFDKVDVFARVSPANKLEIVQALQATGHVVAMTGDGINDMPALKAADIGVAMGTGSGNVVHDVADVVIEDDNLQTLINAVSQGRTIYNNIRKSVHFLLSTNLGEIIVTTLATVAGLGKPLNTMELLWLNLVTDILPSLALAVEPPEPNILDRPPRDPDEPILKSSDFRRIGIEASTISLCAIAAYGYTLVRYGQGRKANTTLFMSLTIGQVLHTWSCRSESHSIFNRQKLERNLYVEGAIALSLALQILPIVFPPLRNLLQLEVLDPLDWSIVVSTAFLALLINESTKTTGFASAKPVALHA